MSTTCEVPFEPLALDGSNYSSWCSNVLIALNILDPTAKRIMVASILPKDETCISPLDLEKKQLNAVITNLLCSCVLLTVKIRQPSHEFTFGVGITFVSYSLVLTPVV
jgi:hypothetical protein